MYWTRFVALTLVVGAVTVAHGDEEALKSGPQPGTATRPVHVPGSFQVWMVTGSHPLRYHSVVCEHGLDPVALIFVKDLDADDKALVNLLKKFEEQIVKHPDARFGCAAIVLNDGGFREALEKEDDDFTKGLPEAAKYKADLEAKLTELAKNEKLERVGLGFDAKTGPKNYQLNEEAEVTILVYNKHVVLHNYAFKEKLKDEDVDRIAADVEKIVLEVERLSRPAYRNKKN